MVSVTLVLNQVDKSKGPQHMRELVRQRQADLQRLWRSTHKTHGETDDANDPSMDSSAGKDGLFRHVYEYTCVANAYAM